MVAALAAITTTRALRRTKDMRSRIARSFPPGPSGGPARGTPPSRERCTRRTYQRRTSTVLGAAHEEIAQLWIPRPTRRLDLVPGAVLRILVRAEPQEPRPVAKALLLHLVEAHLADDLGPHLVPRQIAALRPARAALGCPAPLLFRPQMPLLAERRQQLLELRPGRRGSWARPGSLCHGAGPPGGARPAAARARPRRARGGCRTRCRWRASPRRACGSATPQGAGASASRRSRDARRAR